MMAEGIELLRAVANCSPHKVKLLLDQGVDIQARDPAGQTALHVAVTSGFIGLTKLLLEHGADVNVTDYAGHTSLHCAVLARSDKVVQQILNKNAEIKHRNRYGQTALHMAALLCDWKIMNTLLQKGADVEARNGDGMTPLQIIISKKFFIGEIDLDDLNSLVNVNNERNETPLHTAVNGCWVNLVRVLLSKGAEVDRKNKIGCTPLHTAVKANCEPLVSVLLEFGADPNLRNERNFSPLHCAFLKRNLSMMDELLKKGADTEYVDDKGKTLFLMSIENSFVPGATLLLDSGAELNRKSRNGDSPLHCALRHRNVTLIEELLDKGAEIEVTNEFGDSPLTFAVNNLFEPEFDLLVDRGADFNSTFYHSDITPLTLVVLQKNIVFFKKLYEKGADVNLQDSRGRTLFFKMVEDGFEAGVKFVLEKGDNIVMKDSSGQTPLHVTFDNNEIVDLLLKHGIDLESRDNHGKTPLLSLLSAGSYNCSIAAAILIDKGANIRAVDNKGNTALHYTYLINELTEKLLVSGADPNAKNKIGEAPVHVFARFSVEKLELLLAEGGNLDLENDEGLTPLQILRGMVVIDPNVREVRSILSAINMCRQTLLHIAVDYCCVNLVVALVDKGADVNAADCQGNTPLHFAVKLENNNGLKIVQILTSSGALVNMRNGRGQTPLHLAAEFGRREIVEELLVRGACKDITDNVNQAPVDLWPATADGFGNLVGNCGD